MFSSPAIAAGSLYIGSHAGTLVAIDLDKHIVAWTFSTDGANRNAGALTKKDGDPNYGAAFSDSFYDDLVMGVWKMLSVGAVLSSPGDRARRDLFWQHRRQRLRDQLATVRAGVRLAFEGAMQSVNHRLGCHSGRPARQNTKAMMSA